MHAPRLEQKTGLPDSYIIAKTEVQTIFLMLKNVLGVGCCKHNSLHNESLSRSWRLRREKRRKRGRRGGRRGERRGKRRRGKQRRRSKK